MVWMALMKTDLNSLLFHFLKICTGNLSSLSLLLLIRGGTECDQIKETNLQDELFPLATYYTVKESVSKYQ